MSQSLTESTPVATTLRTLCPGDETAFVALHNRVYHRDPISIRQFVRQTLLDPNFSADGLWIAEQNGSLSGFALAVAPGVPHLFGQPPGVGRLTGLGVLPDHRGQGIETALLDKALGFLRSRHCERVVVAAHEYFVAGVDKDAYPELFEFLRSQGFVVSDYEAVAMGCLLYDIQRPEKVVAHAEKLTLDGLTVGYYEPNRAFALIEFFRTEFPEWVEFFAHQLDGPNEPDDVVVAREGDKIIGYCQRLEGDHVGPFGVAKAYRSRGVGTIMLYALLDRMREKGYRFAWFGETGRAKSYYERVGFKLERTYAILSRAL